MYIHCPICAVESDRSVYIDGHSYTQRKTRSYSPEDEYLSWVNGKWDDRRRLDIRNELIRFIFQLGRDVTADG